MLLACVFIPGARGLKTAAIDGPTQDVELVVCEAPRCSVLDAVERVVSPGGPTQDVELVVCDTPRCSVLDAAERDVLPGPLPEAARLKLFIKTGSRSIGLDVWG